VEAGNDSVDEPRGGNDTDENENGSGKGEKCSDSSSSFAGFFPVAAAKEIGIDGDEGS
jgi:hypothetical protein